MRRDFAEVSTHGNILQMARDTLRPYGWEVEAINLDVDTGAGEGLRTQYPYPPDPGAGDLVCTLNGSPTMIHYHLPEPWESFQRRLHQLVPEDAIDRQRRAHGPSSRSPIVVRAS